MNWDRPTADRIHVAYWFTVLVYLTFHVMVFETDVYVAFVVIYRCCVVVVLLLLLLFLGDGGV